MIRDINLIDYLPFILQEYKEIEAIMTSENPEFQLIIDKSEIIRNNQFVISCNLEGIVRFEKMLNIFPSENDTLGSRISRVLTRWNDIVPYTYRALIQKLIQLCNGLNFIINQNINEYKMEIITNLEVPGQIDDLQYLLDYMIPANIELTSKNEIHCNANGELYIPTGLCYCHTFDLSDSFSDEYIINANSKVGGIYNETVQIIISDNFNELITINGTNEIGSTTSVTQITGIN